MAGVGIIEHPTRQFGLGERTKPMAQETTKVIFSGENPNLELHKPGNEEVVARASYWRCVFSEAGDGNALLFWLAAGALGDGAAEKKVLYTDNPNMAKIVIDNMNSHFGGWTELNFGQVAPTYARFFQEGDGRWYHRVVANTGNEAAELMWWDVIDYQHVIRQDYALGSNHFDLTTVICPCKSASIAVNGKPVAGDVRWSSDGAKPQSSAFLAFSETWSKR
jgi:hypothetical protein